MRRYIGALSGVQVEVQVASRLSLAFKYNYSWRENVNIYLQGQREGHGNMVHGPTLTSSRVCITPAHAVSAQGYVGEQFTMMVAMLTVFISLIYPSWCLVQMVGNHGDTTISEGAMLLLVPIYFVAVFALFSGICDILRRGRSIILCNCGNAQEAVVSLIEE